jgi:hypothetical protein
VMAVWHGLTQAPVPAAAAAAAPAAPARETFS